MIQEEKQILLRDLCARLPYGVRARFCDGVKEEIDDVWDIDMFSGAINADYIIDDIKPYLRSMLSMTDDERKELSKILNYEFYIDDDFALVAEDDRHRIRLDLLENCIDWLNEHMFDYRELIEKGLALEAPERMYKTE